jgi:hypothetical protein
LGELYFDYFRFALIHAERLMTSGWPGIWTQLREAAGGRFERGAFQENRAS